MKIQGIGIISALGRGIETLQGALENGPVEPSRIAVPFQTEPFSVYAVDGAILKDPVLLRGARRADRFSKMATLAAADAVRDAGVELDPSRTGLVLGTAFGPHPTVFSFLDEILEFGDAAVSPTLFSHSVHNAAASYISVALGLAGPAMTITSFADPFYQSLLIAQNWLEQGICDSVLVGCAEEIGTVLEYAVSQKLTVADGTMRPFFDADGPAVIPGEGAVFLLLTRDAGAVSVMTGDDRSVPDLRIADFENTEQPSEACGCWSYLAGSSPLSGAVSCAAAILMLSAETVYSNTSLVEVQVPGPSRIHCIGRKGHQLSLEKNESK